MRGANIDFGELAGASRRMQSKQFVSELHERGLGRDEAVEMLCLVFCIPRAHARLFVASHPVWAAGWASKDSDGGCPLTTHPKSATWEDWVGFRPW